MDAFGNRTVSVAKGCTEGCWLSSPDETIRSVTTPDRRPDEPTGWLWRTTESYVVGASNEKRHHTTTTYDAKGRPESTGIHLTGSLPLDRFHEGNAGGSAGAGGGYAVALTPTNASQDTSGTAREVSRTTYDDFGHAILARGVEHRCRTIVYDAAYADLPTEETIHAGEVEGDCGKKLLTSRVDKYDRGLGAILKVRALHNEETRAEYDQFGRIHRLYAPKPEASFEDGVANCAAHTTPSVTNEYLLTVDPALQPYSQLKTWSHTSLQASADGSDVIESWAYVDGMGRTVVTLAEADPDTEFGDGHPWIVQGLTDYDLKGAARKAYLPWFWDGSDASQFPLSYEPTTPYGRQRYDAFGRQVQTFGLDGTVTLQTKHHALSTDAWDAADLAPGPHQGTYASAAKDGHGRGVDTVERIHVGEAIEERHTLPSYLPTGEVALLRRHRGSLATVPAAGDVVRWMRYDSLGRMVLNVEPNTTANFSPDPATDSSSLKAWRYAYSDAGDLVGTSDARGCGANYHYDSAGRLVAEDYSPCLLHHAPYSAPNLSTGTGTEVFTQYDEYSDADLADLASTAVGSLSARGFTGSAWAVSGRVASVRDRGARVMNEVDCRGRTLAVAKQMVKPGAPSDDLAQRYAARWYVQRASYDAADRLTAQTTGATVSELLGTGNESKVAISYTANGKVKQVGGSYGTLVHHTRHDADGKTLEVQYGDLAATKTSFTYDDRRRVKTVQTYRGPPNCWTATDPPPECHNYHPTVEYGSSTPSTFPLLLEDTEFTYDAVDNPVEIKDWRLPSEWPAGAKPVSRTAQYDDLYRLTRLDYQYSDGDDAWVSPYAAEVGTHPPAWGNPPGGPGGTLDDPRRAKPSPHVSFPKRVQQQSYAYDWLGNTTASDDDAHGFYDRSLGAVQNGTPSAGPYQLQGAANDQGGSTARRGHLSAAYDAAGNLVDLAVNRATPMGECLPAGASCHQRFLYAWDEVGRLVQARRWDTATTGAAGDAAPGGSAAADLRYGYDGSDQRVLKTAAAENGDERHTAYVFSSLELRRATWMAGEYEQTVLTEVGYLFAGGVQLGRLHHDERALPLMGEAKLHVLLELADHLGSTSTVLDRDTGELAERMTYQGYGATESDYRPGRWGTVRDDHRFTGKEEDSEVGIFYFGKRFLNASVGRWMNGDPLAIHSMSADLNIYAYVHGSILSSIDPYGLEEHALSPIKIDPGLREVTARIVSLTASFVPTKSQLVTELATKHVNVYRTSPAPNEKDTRAVATNQKLDTGEIELTYKESVADVFREMVDVKKPPPTLRQMIRANAPTIFHEQGHTWIHKGFLGNKKLQETYDHAVHVAEKNYT